MQVESGDSEEIFGKRLGINCEFSSGIPDAND